MTMTKRQKDKNKKRKKETKLQKDIWDTDYNSDN